MGTNNKTMRSTRIFPHLIEEPPSHLIGDSQNKIIALGHFVENCVHKLSKSAQHYALRMLMVSGILTDSEQKCFF